MRSRDFTFEQSNRLWVINGNVWDKNRVDANPELEQIEIWTLHNNSGLWFHPVHLHLIDAQILDRNGQPPFPYERGMKDVFYVVDTLRSVRPWRLPLGEDTQIL